MPATGAEPIERFQLLLLAVQFQKFLLMNQSFDDVVRKIKEIEFT
jgi:hypothetical protein